MVNVADSGIWLGCVDGTADDEITHVLGTFATLGEALEEFACLAEQAADQVERSSSIDLPDVIASVLRYRAAAIRADAAKATAGDAFRRNQARIGRGAGLGPVLHEAGLSREALGPVLAGQDYAWPQGPPVQPPGSLLPDTPVTTLASYSIDGHQFTLFSYQDTSGGKCVGIDRDGVSMPVCDVTVDEQHLLGAGMTMATRGRGLAAIYGRAHDSVTELYAVMKDGSRVDWPIHDDPRNQERYFAVVADSEALADIVGVAPSGSISLKRNFGVWFSKPPRKGSSAR